MVRGWLAHLILVTPEAKRPEGYPRSFCLRKEVAIRQSQFGAECQSKNEFRRVA
jgi:hypothetical protein